MHIVKFEWTKKRCLDTKNLLKFKKAVFSSDAKHPDALVFVSIALLIDPSKSVLLA